MNVTELARRLRVPTKELLDILPQVGFDIGRRAIKVDDRIANKIIQQWSALYAKYREQHQAAEETAIAQVAMGPSGPRTVTLPSLIRVRDFAEKLGLPLPKVMGQLMKNGVLSAMNEYIDFDTASVIAQDFGFETAADTTSAEETTETTTAEKLKELLTETDSKQLKSRPPVVVVMGHVDHGKTKLLDAIRSTNVIDTESGGITQHIGAYQVEKSGRMITFIDTPGHEAFTTMRSRGARIADIAILVVAADDSIQPQTKESIKIIKSAGLSMIVAINKIDKPDANPERVKQDLASLELLPEEWGGKTICVPISAKQGTGIDELLAMILLVADTEREKIMANPNRQAVGTIIEARVDKGEGPVATVLVQNGTLHRGDLITISGSYYGKIRAMKSFTGEPVESAGPSTPVRILGLKVAPGVGDVLEVTAEVERKEKVKKYQLTEQSVASTKTVEIKDAEKSTVQALNFVIKADVLGSLDAIINTFTKFEHPELAINIVGKGLGNISDGDIERAVASQAVVYGFHVKPTAAADLLAKEKGIEIKLYDVIYQLFDDVHDRLQEMLRPEVTRTDVGRLKVLAVFYKDKTSMVVGGQVVKGVAAVNVKADIMRDDTKLATGTITELQANKVAVNEVEHGHECGLRFEGKTVIEPGDIVEMYTEKVTEKKLERF